MIRDLIQLFIGENDPAKLRIVIRRQRVTIDRLLKENAELRAQNRQLRRRLGDRDLRLLRQAEFDCILMGSLYFAEQSISRRACKLAGIGDRRWRRAVALLQVGRVHNRKRVTVETPEEFEAGLRVAGERVRRDGMDPLLLRMPPCLKKRTD